MHQVDIAIPPASVYVGIVRLTVASLARSAGFDEARIDDIRIAVSEACTNAVLTNEEAGCSDPVTVGWSEEPDRVVVEVTDGGGTPHDEPPMEDSQGFSTRVVMSVALLGGDGRRPHLRPGPAGGSTAKLTFGPLNPPSPQPALPAPTHTGPVLRGSDRFARR